MTLIQLGEDVPSIDETAWIAPNATVIGKVTLAAGASVWYSTVIRGDMDDITIGENSNIQDGCALHTDPGFTLTVGTGVSVGHNAILHGCTIGNDVLVGMGATVLNGAVIGDGAMIAANALIPQGAVIPPGTLVAGVPGKVRRELSEDEINHIKLNAAAYGHLRDVHRGAKEV
ncbi:MAG: gamma carbonic anhydrase family protein [Nocardiaceae bacterium]|nr:gamma carbonic anhydrase family protein [Nocardiaceae bacterium]